MDYEYTAFDRRVDRSSNQVDLNRYYNRSESGADMGGRKLEGLEPGLKAVIAFLQCLRYICRHGFHLIYIDYPQTCNPFLKTQ